MTEKDLIRIEQQIENLTVMHKVSEVEKELEELERQLHQLLPVSAALNQGHFSVNPKQVHGQAEDLPEWCSKISTLLKNMAILLATLGGKEIDILDLACPGYSPEVAKNANSSQSSPGGSVPPAFMGRSQSFSTREDVENEIRQCGVSVKNLKANYEIQSQSQAVDNRANKVYKRKRSLPVVSESNYRPETTGEDGTLSLHQSNTNGPLPSVEESNLPLVEEPLIVASQAPLTYAPTEAMAPNNIDQFNHIVSADPILNDDQLTRSLEVQTDLSYVQECIEMRKERIVFLFLEHWRKYTLSESYRPKNTRRANQPDSVWADYNEFSQQICGEMHSEDDKLLLFMKSKQVVGNLIGHWRTIMSQVPTRQIRRLSRAQMIYWPEHFLPHINGSPVSYESLTLDLFMLGYFQLLEMNMSRKERKFRHLLCYEMFDRLGTHKWEVIRQFHKELMEEIESGKRDWLDGYEDVKLKYFGESSEEGGVMTASLQNMTPDMSIMPIQESLPPPPSHPPPPPPPVQPAPPPPNTQSVPPAPPSHPAPSAPPSPPPEAAAASLEGAAGGEELSDGKCDTTAPQDPVKDIPPATVKIIEEPHVDKPPPREEPNEDSIKTIYELKEFSNEEIIRYIDRSFTFWKEKEKELFDI